MLRRRVHSGFLLVISSQTYLRFEVFQIISYLVESYGRVIQSVENRRVVFEIVESRGDFKRFSVFVFNVVYQIERGFHIMSFVKPDIRAVKPILFVKVSYKILKKRLPYLLVFCFYLQYLLFIFLSLFFDSS